MSSHPFFGKTVYILGAGASAPSGAPTLAKFLSVAENIRRSKALVPEIQSFKRVFDHLDELRSSRASTVLDFDNLEDVFSLCSLESQTGVIPPSLLEDLLAVITQTLDATIELRPCHAMSGPYFSDPTYDEFVKGLQSIKRYQNEASRDQCAQDSIITFNYDLLLEQAFAELREPLIYGPESAPGFPLLKLHGSLNWFVHKDCSEEKMRDTPYFIPISNFKINRSPNGNMVFDIFNQIRNFTPCPSCKISKVVTPVLVPPTWEKSPPNTMHRSIWSKAVEECTTADRIVIIGYSMPNTDNFFKYLLAAGLRRNKKLRKVVIVNNNSNLFERFKGLFPQNIQMSTLEEPFESFVKHMPKSLFSDPI